MKDLHEDLKYLIDKRDELADDAECFEIDNSKHEESFDEMLDELYPSIFGKLPSRIMSELDPIMYKLELGYYVDGLDKEDDEDYKTLVERIELMNDEIEQLEQEIELQEDKED